jgi:hypothetical protein
MGKNIQCPKIIRTEGLDLLPMVSNFLIKYGNAISNKDTVLIGNANQLLKEGLEGYIGTPSGHHGPDSGGVQKRVYGATSTNDLH